ncbi:uncharacterized protein LOC121415563 isoform X2 [Lytechinus variegatus]|uniref:uncharacterized protein LOC121415563 isoform X2 n=1 Tax=Lytechinus variegatus TaxID=7654 RepID=UPI001BB14E92|nr:uncharacterized protein LOC121415563 isoform X2 [Lytechinus variegatus]
MASQISDSEREALAQAIGINPKLDILGLKLSFKHEDMDIYKADNYSGHRVTNEGTKRMLRDFCDKTPLEQQRPLLKKALEDAGLVRLAELHLTDSTSQAASSSSGQAAVSETGRVTGQQPATQSRPSVSNTINASGSSSVSGNIMIGQQTNVHNSTPSAPVVHQHFTTNVKQAAAPAHAVARPIIIRPPVAVPMGQKRSANTSQNPQNPPAKRQKVTQSGPSTSKGVTAKQKKAPNPQKKTQKKKAPQTAKAKNPKAPKASKKPAQKKNGPQSKKTQKKTTAKRQNPKSHKKAKMSKAKTAGKGRSKKK